MDITNKKELVALFAEPIVQGFSPEGKMITYTLFSELPYTRAEAISSEIYANITDYLAEHHRMEGKDLIIEVEMNLPEFARVCLRNIELNGSLEILHATLQIGYMFSLTVAGLSRLKADNQTPNIGDN